MSSVVTTMGEGPDVGIFKFEILWMESFNCFSFADFYSYLPRTNSIMECDFVVFPDVSAEIGVGDLLHGSIFFR